MIPKENRLGIHDEVACFVAGVEQIIVLRENKLLLVKLL
jgi:hypothetical protein